MSAILAIDQGTTNTKAILVDAEGRILHRASSPVGISFPEAGWVEQDPLELWESVRTAIDECLSAAGSIRPAGVALSNQRESVVVWERSTGHPLGPVIVWQCRRTSSICDRLRSRGVEAEIRSRSGLPIDPLFSASKVRWLLDQIPSGDARAHNGELCVGTIDSWLLWNLTGGAEHRCDVSNASRTQLLNLNDVAWDDELLRILDIPSPALPEVLPSGAHFGETVSHGRLPGGLPVAAMMGDSHAALFGHCGFEPGVAKATYGTGSSVMTPVKSLPPATSGLSSTIAWAIGTDVTYALEGNISVTGAAVQWLVDLLGLESPDRVAVLASSVEHSGGVYCVPAFVGLGAPYWREKARGLVTGITRGTTASHLARAVIESIAFQVGDVFEAMAAEVGDSLALLQTDGGASQNDALMQFQADILGLPVLRNNATDLAALGAAYMGGLTLGMWDSLKAIEMLPHTTDRFEPKKSAEGRRAAWAGWRDAVARTLYEPHR